MGRNPLASHRSSGSCRGLVLIILDLFHPSLASNQLPNHLLPCDMLCLLFVRLSLLGPQGRDSIKECCRDGVCAFQEKNNMLKNMCTYLATYSIYLTHAWIDYVRDHSGLSTPSFHTVVFCHANCGRPSVRGVYTE